MNRIFYILILCLSHFFSGYAQSDLFSRLPQEERDGFYENACHYIQNTYYYQIAEAIANPAIHKYLIEYLMASDEARFQPEAIPEASKQRLLSPSQYLMSLSHAFRKDSELEFSVSNFGYNNQVKSNPDNPLNCFIQVEYDLEKARRSMMIKIVIKIILNIFFDICIQLLFLSFFQIGKTQESNTQKYRNDNYHILINIIFYKF